VFPATAGYIPEYHPVTLVPQWLRVTGQLAKEFPAPPVKRTHVKLENNVWSHDEFPPLYDDKRVESLIFMYVEQRSGRGVNVNTVVMFVVEHIVVDDVANIRNEHTFYSVEK
jgi:hypothetical protein